MDVLRFMREFTITSSKDSQKGDEINTEPFRLNSVSENDSSEFQVIFIHQGKMYRYGFECDTTQGYPNGFIIEPTKKRLNYFTEKSKSLKSMQRISAKAILL